MAHITSEKALKKLTRVDEKFSTLFKHGSLEVEIYKPENVDLQTPHTRDEIYVIIQGNGNFKNGEENITFSAGDFLFVKAGVDHRFIDFSEDFCTWVFFYGPEGGEDSQ